MEATCVGGFIANSTRSSLTSDLPLVHYINYLANTSTSLCVCVYSSFVYVMSKSQI